ncbi:sugar transporter [Mucilaginibacter limnophilus]|uniref:Sugar transporter n=1 Tax=Mucilaginibacter limnophilus TaxID=1932778 RepID=A0A437MSV2_9SPHI|nr:polysaccharide biosynthesis/export family protein [Mucilaginibacter limnophilus]RVU00720.1 sugar transporter [Mucilaginibacter limnophilus]
MVCFAVLVLLSSCGVKRNLVYLSDLNDTAKYTWQIKNHLEPRIQPGDNLAITVSNVDQESSNLFNKGVLPAANPVSNGTIMQSVELPEYLVDKDGNINFPAIGKISVAGLTIEEAVLRLTQTLSKSVKNPIVEIKFTNFKVTVIGEVNRPGVFNIPNSRVNVLEALGLAGDMTQYGKRENVIVVHEENCKRSLTHLNLNSSDMLQSPSFYLQQNDVVYVAPDKLKERQARTDTRSLSIVVAAATVITVIISRLF